MTAKELLSGGLTWGRETAPRKLALLAFLLGALIMATHRPFIQREGGDTAFYDYVAQSVVRGQMPYRDVVDIKWPGAAYLSATAIVVARPFGIRDIIAIRLLYVLLVGLLSALIFLVAEAYLCNRDAAIIACLFPLMLPHFADWMTSGTEPKLPLLVFGMLSLLLVARDQPFWAGLFSMLACLCWQPGLMFTGVAVLMFSRYLTTWRDLRAIKCAIGAIIPFALMLSYFYLRGSLGDLWAWTITYNYSVFGPDATRSTAESLGHIWKVMTRVLRFDVVMVPLSVIGLIVFAAERIRAKVQNRRLTRLPDLYLDALLFPPLIYFAFCLVNFQAGPDLIPLIPFVAIFGAKALVDAATLAGSQLQKAKLSAIGWNVLIPRLVIGLMLMVVLYRGARYKPDQGAIRDQDKAFTAISKVMGPDDRIYVHGTAEILVLLNRSNLNPYVFLDWGADDFAAARRGIEFSAIVDEMEAQAPKVISITRLKVVLHRDDFRRWVAKSYEELDVPGYEGVYVRK